MGIAMVVPLVIVSMGYAIFHARQVHHRALRLKQLMSYLSRESESGVNDVLRMVIVAEPVEPVEPEVPIIGPPPRAGR